MKEGKSEMVSRFKFVVVLMILLSPLVFAQGDCPADPPTPTAWPKAATYTPQPTPTCKPTRNISQAIEPSPTPHPTSTPYPTPATDCDIILAPNETTFDGDVRPVNPGAVVCLEAGGRSHLDIRNVHGAAGSPVEFKNVNGVALFWGSDWRAITVRRSSHVRITGTGWHGADYGIMLQGGSTGVYVWEYADFVEVDHVEIMSTIGVFLNNMDTTDPSQGHDFHDNWLHDNGAEGFYIGSGGYSVKEARIHHNRIEGPGRDGIQFANCDGCLIYGNTVLDAGQNAEPTHSTGILVGGGDSTSVYNNIVQNSGRDGVYVGFGTSNLRVFNNLVVRSGAANPDGHGVKLDDSAQVEAFHNTIVDSANYGLMVTPRADGPVYLWNNLAVGNVGGGFGGAFLGERNMVSDDHDAFFIDAAEGDYHLEADAPSVDVGYPLLWHTFDLDWNERPQGAGYDIGAYER